MRVMHSSSVVVSREPAHQGGPLGTSSCQRHIQGTSLRKTALDFAMTGFPEECKDRESRSRVLHRRGRAQRQAPDDGRAGIALTVFQAMLGFSSTLARDLLQNLEIQDTVRPLHFLQTPAGAWGQPRSPWQRSDELLGSGSDCDCAAGPVRSPGCEKWLLCDPSSLRSYPHSLK